MEVSDNALEKEYFIRGKIINSKSDFLLLSLSISSGLVLFLIILYIVVKIYNFEWSPDSKKEDIQKESLDDIEGLDDVVEEEKKISAPVVTKIEKAEEDKIEEVEE